MTGIKKIFADLQDFYTVSVRSILCSFRRPHYLKDLLAQMDYTGAGSFFIVFLISLFIGAALSLQLSTELAPVGLKIYTARMVGVAIIREIGPVIIALSYAGRVGAGMSSEIGSMVLGHQVDVLRVYGVDPIKKLVTPRVIGSTIMLPVLTIVGDALALVGAYYVAVFVSNQSGSYFWSQIAGVLDFQNIFSGVSKPFVFGYAIACISCYMGLSTSGGAQGLRRSTTKAVVFSIICIVILNFVITRILFFVLGMRV
jgi:phospholipid/cholesterol/gamma-HCH transport system permease protein